MRVCDSFNPRAREGRDIRNAVIVSGEEGFNPRAREGRDLDDCENYANRGVSIHAPARGATFISEHF